MIAAQRHASHIEQRSTLLRKYAENKTRSQKPSFSGQGARSTVRTGDAASDAHALRQDLAGDGQLGFEWVLLMPTTFSRWAKPWWDVEVRVHPAH